MESLMLMVFVVVSFPVAWTCVRLYRLYGRARRVTGSETTRPTALNMVAMPDIASNVSSNGEHLWPGIPGSDRARGYQFKISPDWNRPGAVPTLLPNGRGQVVVFGQSTRPGGLLRSN